MADSCYCDYGESPDVYEARVVTARKAYRCYECARSIMPREKYERVGSLYDGAWSTTRTCCRCLAVRHYIEAHAPCFCWQHGSMLDDARYTLREYGHESYGFYLGGMKRVLRAERHVA